MAASEAVGEPYGRLLRLLVVFHEPGEDGGPLYRRQPLGATYRQAAAIAYRAGMGKQEYVRWYRMCESIPLSQRHAGHSIGPGCKVRRHEGNKGRRLA
jgi:hypothetical protein